MREFMDYVRNAFYDSTSWNRESSYSSLNSTANALLNFPTPIGVRLTLSALASPNFATSYQLGSVGVVDGSISYLYSSVPLHLHLTPRSDRTPLATLLQSYKPLTPLPRRDGLGDSKPYPLLSPSAASLLYGRLYLPESLLEALIIKRISPTLQFQLSAVSGQFLRDGGTLLGLAQYDVGRYALEGLASSDGGLLGFRGLYNFGSECDNGVVPLGASLPSASTNSATEDPRERIYGRFSAGAEIYYGTLNKSGGISVGTRFATLPEHSGTPLTTTLTLNPLMGNISATYALMAGRNCSLATRFDFNVHSYESDWAVGMELWRKRAPEDSPVMEAENFVKERSFQAKMEWRLDNPPAPPAPSPVAKPQPAPSVPEKRRPKERSFQAKLEWRLDDPEEQAEVEESNTPDEEYMGVLKARLDQNLRVGMLWEGRAKALLFSVGTAIDLRKMESPFRTIGLEVQYSS